ncbi:Satratoxin biosynthesis SC1 cluster protein 4 [Metarhizium brunneum]|uniref:Satratoxin biosynthesis SC1 cluster protein 4 n=1 Tax=Metarhizium brunneum TaxID=500148 RepID=A0A7D5Z3V4_9HYPO
MDEVVNLSVGAVMAVLAIVAVVARFYARHSRKAKLQWDDWLIVVSLVAMIATDILAICAITGNPTGPETATVVTDTHEYAPEDVLYTKLSWATTVIYFAITSTTKLSILLMYNRLFSVDERFRRIVMILSVLVVGFWVGCTVADLTNCVPMEYVWINSLSDPRYCFNFNIYWFASGVCEALIDTLILLLPIKVVLGLQLGLKQKVAVGSVFLLGAFVIVSGLLKTSFGYIPGSRQPSFSRTQLWTSVHCGTGIICACLPICWPLFGRLWKLHLPSWPGALQIREYWYRLRGEHSAEKSRKPSGASDGEFQLSNNFTSRGFTVSFGGIHEEQVYREDYSTVSHVPHRKHSVSAV